MAERPEGPEMPGPEEASHPRGTLILMLFYLVVLIAAWVYVYLLMTQRA